MTPKVSVILATHNGYQYLPYAIGSVLSQDYNNLELIIVDDGSTDDNTLKLLGSIHDDRVKIIKNEKQLSLAAALNKGIEAASGEFIARIDDDDEFISSSKIRLQIEFLVGHHDCVLVGTNMKMWDKDKNAEIMDTHYPAEDKSIKAVIMRYNPIVHSSVVFRASAFTKAGGYNPAYTYLQDWDLWMRMGKIGKLANLSSVDVKWRTSQKRQYMKSAFKELLATQICYEYRHIYPGAWPNIIRHYLRSGIFGLIGIFR